MNPYETPPSSLDSSSPGLLPRATNLRSFCGKLAWAGVIMAVLSIGFTLITSDAFVLLFAGLGVLLGMITATVAVAWAWIAILLESIARARNRNRAS